MRLAFRLPGSALPWMRAGRSGKTSFTPTRLAVFYDALRWNALSVRPIGWPQESRYMVRMVASWATAHTRDVDNAQKSLGDALEGILWANDGRIDAWEPIRGRVTGEPNLLVIVEEADRVALDARVEELEALASIINPRLRSAGEGSTRGTAPRGRKVSHGRST